MHVKLSITTCPLLFFATHRHLLRHPDAAWEDIPNLPRGAVEVLRAQFAALTTSLAHADRSADGNTIKLLVRLQDGLEVESVVIPYNTTAGGCERGRRGAFQGPQLSATPPVCCHPRPPPAR